MSSGFQLARLRRGEWVAGAGALVLLASTLALKWYALRAPLARTAEQLGLSASVTGWQALSVTRWFILATALLGLVVWYTQGSRRAPALPVAATVVLAPLALLTSLLLIDRVLINRPGPDVLISIRAGAVVGMVSAFAVTAGAYLSLREDGVRRADAPAEIETVRLDGRPAGAT